MKKALVICLLSLFWAVQAGAVVIDFTGGTVTNTDASTGVTTSGYDFYSQADYYVENGFKLDFINAEGGGEYIGDYYSNGGDPSTFNDVIHGHWAPNHGDMTAVEITKVGGGAFDLNYFILTSNTLIGGGSAVGTETAYIQAWSGGSLSYQQLLPPESWGLDALGQNPGPLQNDPAIYLGAEFDAVDLVRFIIDSALGDVYCFGMDEFYIDQAAPPAVPEPSTFVLLGGGLAGLAFMVRRRKKE